ncbi:MAG: hypothetical protein IPN95_16775 [Bacteroidetes bacterium]|nr:hypothetical protein [Bacteroidota bacterium]MBP6640715.1 hypothetical protein [Bacteroidia bacterium]
MKIFRRRLPFESKLGSARSLIFACGLLFLTTWGCVEPECPPTETITVHDTVTVFPKPARYEDIVGYFDPVDMVVYARPGHEKAVLEFFNARNVRADSYKIVATAAGGETFSAMALLKLVDNPGDFKRPPQIKPSRAVGGTIYSNSQCISDRSPHTTRCTYSVHDSLYFRSQVLNTGFCMAGEGYCFTLDSMKTEVWQYFQDSECKVLVKVHAVDSRGIRCLPK